VFAAGTEDMDTLTFQSPVLLRHLTSPLSKKEPILEIHHEQILEGLGIDAEQFVDLCILCGCDYCGTIKGIGPKSALKAIRQHKNIETFLKHLDKKKFPPPDDWLGETPIFVQARELFLKHVTFKAAPGTKKLMDLEDLEVPMKWEDCDEKGLTEFLVDKWGFNADRVKSGIEKLKKSKTMASQQRMDSFFTRVKPPEATNKKRKIPPKKAGGKNAKKIRGNSGFRRK
jgi:flap endonuclease-1